MNAQVGDRAVVLGASLAGLLTAQVLADAYGQSSADAVPMPRR